jgi:hypothetical protein
MDGHVSGSIELKVAPTIADKYLLVQDQMIVKILGRNAWRRPLCFSTLLPENSINWLKPYLRLDGLYWRLVPSQVEAAKITQLKENLLGRFSYRGYAERSIPKEPPSEWIAWNLTSAFLSLASMQNSFGDTSGCRNTVDQLRLLLPPAALSTPAELSAAIGSACD